MQHRRPSGPAQSGYPRAGWGTTAPGGHSATKRMDFLGSIEVMQVRDPVEVQKRSQCPSVLRCIKPPATTKPAGEKEKNHFQHRQAPLRESWGIQSLRQLWAAGVCCLAGLRGSRRRAQPLLAADEHAPLGRQLGRLGGRAGDWRALNSITVPGFPSRQRSSACFCRPQKKIVEELPLLCFPVSGRSLHRRKVRWVR